MAGRRAGGGWDPSRSAAGNRSPWLIVGIISIATFMEVLDTSIANVSLNHIAGSLSVSPDEFDLGADQLPRRQRGRHPDLGLAVERDRPQALLHDVGRAVHHRLVPVRHRAQHPVPGPRAHFPGHRRRRPRPVGAVDARRHLSAGQARPGVRGLCLRRHRRARARPDDRRLGHRQLFLALDLSGQHPRRLPVAVPRPDLRRRAQGADRRAQDAAVQGAEGRLRRLPARRRRARQPRDLPRSRRARRLVRLRLHHRHGASRR